VLAVAALTLFPAAGNLSLVSVAGACCCVLQVLLRISTTTAATTTVAAHFN
jgi:hypothetical protein